MKKFIIIIAAVILSIVNANAQWNSPSYHEGDELKGTGAYYSNLYIDDDGYFICWSNSTDIKIAAKRGIFDYDDNYVSVLIGFYKGTELIEKVNTKFFVPDGDSNTAYSSEYKTKGLGEKVINHLKTVGNVRIIAPKYSGADFDLTIPMNKDLK